MKDLRPSGMTGTLLVGGVLLVAAILLVTLLPIAECPECEGGRVAVVTKIETRDRDEIAGCTTCDDRSKVTLFKKWTYRAPDGGP